MNACLRAVFLSSISAGHDVVGIRRGYQGILDEDFFLADDGRTRMTRGSAADLSKCGGTILGSSRSEDFRTERGLQKASEVLVRHGIDALIPIGGDGTFRGAVELGGFWPGQIVGCPGTIDNDLGGTDKTIGFETAVQTAVDAVDKIYDTAESHERMFLVEVMGRHSGYIATYTALASGAECVCIPETPTDIPGIVQQLHIHKDRGKSAVMMIVAEGDERGGAEELNRQLQQAGCPFSTRIVILGHLQRGGSPCPADRILATRLGHHAVQSILSGNSGCMSGVVGGQCVLTPFAESVAGHKPIPEELLNLLDTLSC